MTDPTEHPPGLVGMPCHNWMYTRAVQSLVGLGSRLPSGSGLHIREKGTTISQKRNKIIRDVLAEPRFGWVFFLDSDMVVPPDVVPRLLGRDLPVVGGLYFQRAADYWPEAWYIRTRGEDPLRRTDVDDFEMQSLNMADLDRGQEVAEVDAVGGGCLLVRREVLEAVGPPWFVASEEKDAGLNEDLNFCLRVQEAGFPVHVDVTVRTEHLGVVGIDHEYASDHWESEVPLEQRDASAPPPALGGTT